MQNILKNKKHLVKYIAFMVLVFAMVIVGCSKNSNVQNQDGPSLDAGQDSGDGNTESGDNDENTDSDEELDEGQTPDTETEDENDGAPDDGQDGTGDNIGEGDEGQPEEDVNNGQEGSGGNAGNQGSSDSLGNQPSGQLHPDMFYTEAGYVIYDPENTRGLSNDRIAHSFGVASGGKPHSVSVARQKELDAMNAKAMLYDAKTQDKVIYLTFDCGYEYGNNTSEVLDILKEKDVTAAFFCLLSFYKKNPEVTQRMINEGHILGNHSANHLTMHSGMSRTQMADELFQVDKYLRETYNYKSIYFRPPSGEYCESLLDLCANLGYRTSFWSVAYRDWEVNNQPDPQEALQILKDRLHPGAVYLLHSVSDTNVEILDDFIDYARAQGYTFVSLDDYEW